MPTGVRSIEYAAMAAFFNPKATLDPELADYFARFQQIVSYLYDPDGFFSGNLRRCGVKNLIEASPKIDPEGEHASRQLARPLESLALYLDDSQWSAPAARRETRSCVRRGFPRPRRVRTTRQLARSWRSIPAAAGERKNWPIDRWQ